MKTFRTNDKYSKIGATADVSLCSKYFSQLRKHFLWNIKYSSVRTNNFHPISEELKLNSSWNLIRFQFRLSSKFNPIFTSIQRYKLCKYMEKPYDTFGTFVWLGILLWMCSCSLLIFPNTFYRVSWTQQRLHAKLITYDIILSYLNSALVI